MFESKEEKKRKATRERVRRYREKQKQTVTDCNKDVTSMSKTEGVTDKKIICKCKYYKMVDGVLVCSVCGKPASKQKIEDKIGRDVEFKSGG